MEHKLVVIALGNTAVLNQYTNVATTVSGVINALIERFGCLNVEITVLGILPRPTADSMQVGILKQQNESLYKVVRNLIRRRKYPVKFLPAYKWFLKEFQMRTGTCKWKWM